MPTYQLATTTLILAEGTLDLQSLIVDAHTWFRTDSACLWQILAVDESGQSATLNGSHAATARADQSGDTLTLTWTDVTDAGAGPFDVTVTVRPGEATGSTAWRIAVRNGGASWTLWHVIFPKLNGLQPAGDGADDRQFYPQGWGTLREGWDAMEDLDRRYPRGWDWTMQFVGYTRGPNTLSLSVLDPALTPKRFHFTRHQVAGARSADLSVTCYPEGMSAPGNEYLQEYDTVVAAFDGDWYDAAQRYAVWARKQAWVAPLDPRREVHAWQVAQVPQKPLDVWAEQIETLHQRLGTKLGVHFYNWHQIPFDIDYPDYFPAREGFAELVARVRARGITAMPYINGRLWDINAPSWHAANAERWAAKNSALRVRPRTLFPYLEEYGSGQKLAPMCPATAFWQNTVIDLCRRITSELGCDAVYLDQIAAEAAMLCFDPEHGHTPGGGGYWHAGYREMLARIRQAIGPQAYLTTECNWEGCAADVDALLMWHSIGSGLIPLFPAVYAGMARTFGCQFNARTIENDGGREFADRSAMLFVWGAQLGWGDLTLLLSPEHAALLDFFAGLARLRAEHVNTFASGRLLRDPRIDAPIRSSLWQTPDGGRTLFVVNPTRQALPVTATFDAGPPLSLTLPALSAQAIQV